MTITAGGRSRLILAILATGLFVGFAGASPAGAATDDNAAAQTKSAGTDAASAEADGADKATGRKNTRHSSRHWKRHAERKSSKVALKSSSRKNTDASDGAADSSTNSIPPSVADANAQLAAAGTPESQLAGNARAMSAHASDIVQAAPEQPADAQPAPQVQTVASDQLNEVDRSLTASTPPPPALATAMAQAPDSTETASSDDGSSWDQASLIGKIFIGFGALLTMASAARMLMA
jgi:hypothetical protein